MYRMSLVLVFVVASFLALAFSPFGQEYLPTREWIRQIARSPLGLPISLVFVAMVIGSFIALISPNQRS